MPFTYPEQYEISAIEPLLMLNEQEDRLGFRIMPQRNSDSWKVRWTLQDNFFGLQQMRGLDGRPAHVKRVGAKTYEYEPGVYGEFVDITETELQTRSGSIDPSTVKIKIDDLVVGADRQLIQREMDRKESSIWAVLTTGTITIHGQGANGVMILYQDTFAIQTFTATVPWSTAATSTPMRDFLAVQQLGVPAGTSNNFGQGATAYANSVTWNNMLFNSNASDLAGRRAEGGATFNTIEDISKLFVSRNLPNLVTYDNVYIDDLGITTKMIPDGTVSVIAKRPKNSKIGEYINSRGVHARDTLPSNSYRYVIDRANGTNGEKRTPANIEIHRGHNGGVVLYYASAIARMLV